MNCRFCGTALPEGALFCGECGRAVPVAASTAPSPRRRFAIPPVTAAPAASPLAFSSEPDADPPVRPTVHIPESGFNCPQCGEQITPVDVFCGECGFVLSGLVPSADSRDTAVIDPLPDDYEPFVPFVATEVDDDDNDDNNDENLDAVAGDELELTEIVASVAIAEPESDVEPLTEESVEEPDPEPEAEAEPELEPEAEPELEPEAEPSLSPKRKPSPKLEPEAEAEPEPEAGSRARAGSGSRARA